MQIFLLSIFHGCSKKVKVQKFLVFLVKKRIVFQCYTVLVAVRACGLSIAICPGRPLSRRLLSVSPIPNLNSPLQRGFKGETQFNPSQRLRPFEPRARLNYASGR
jgi:hypothetical protein